MKRGLSPVLCSLLVAGCLVPSMEIVDSLGDAGDGGDGDSGSDFGGTSMNGGVGGRGGSNQGGRTGGQDGSSGSVIPEGGSGAEETAGTSGRDAGGRNSASGTSNGGTGNGGTGGDGVDPGQGGTGNEGSGGSAGDDDPSGNGGIAGLGGNFSIGGAAGSFAGRAGSAGSFGNAGAAGSSPGVTCDAAFAVGTDGFVRMLAVGACWHGYASAGGDSSSQVMPATFSACGVSCMLRVTGTIGATQDYSGVAYVGFNVGQAPGSQTTTKVTPTGSGLVFSFTYSGSATLRAQISSGSTHWCAIATSGAMIPYGSFNTQCWDMQGTSYAKQPIDVVQMVMAGGQTAQPFELTLASVKEM